MTTNQNLLMAILAMDSYNRGYNEGITGLSDAGQQIGPATLTLESDVLPVSPGVSAGFYAVA